MYLHWDGHIATGDPNLDGNLQALDIVTTASGTFLYADTGQDGGVTAYKLSLGSSLLTEIDRAYFPAWMGGAAGGMLDYAVIDGTPQLVLAAARGRLWAISWAATARSNGSRRPAG
ncbi:hypothetical protein [Primorskyibacter sp. 2E233]|uniref:hypothetical protein n=1 Tax=Primorskyibacter sp. 2E233 TaxID=3413431 RepID=UPI003BF3E46D